MKAKPYPPPVPEPDRTWVDRRAKLFEAGDYPDKGISVGEDDLLRLQGSFEGPVPILIEHATSPLQIGYLTAVEAQGRELFGTVSLTKEANDLIEASGAQALSLGLAPGLDRIQEVSLVSQPRVPSARLFHGEVFGVETDWKARFHELEADVACRAAEAHVERLTKEGRIVPAQAGPALALLSQPMAVTFDGESVPVGALVLKLLESSPPHSLFRETAPVGPSAPAMDSDERAFYERYFGGLSLEEIASHRAS